MVATTVIEPAVKRDGELSWSDDNKGRFPQNSRSSCPEDFSPCTCDLTSNRLEVTCFEVKINDILNVFYRIRHLVIYAVTLTASDPGAVNLLADLLSDKHVENIYLNCPSNVSSKVSLTIDPFAFEYSRHQCSSACCQVAHLASRMLDRVRLADSLADASARPYNLFWLADALETSRLISHSAFSRCKTSGKLLLH